MRVYGSKISYFTGKLEAYLRYKGLAYELLPSLAARKTLQANVGAVQMPVVERDDGRWMSDTTPIIQQLEKEHPNPTVMPPDAVVRFIGLLLEDYADEWLWRPAMHYRWSYSHDRELLSSIIVDELLTHIRLPRFLKRRFIQRRQRGGFVVGDGGLYFYVQDIIVVPGYQGLGIGRRIMKEVMDFLEAEARPGAFLGLMAARGKGGFYNRYGFEQRHPESPGMFRVWKDS